MLGLTAPARMRLWILTFLLLAWTGTYAHATGLIRDAEIEFALDTLAAPLITASGLERRPKVLVVNDLALNAFVTDGRVVYIHAGLILRLESAQDLQAVIAHELAHITNGHLTRRTVNAQSAQLGTTLGVALGVAAAVAAGDSRVGVGVAAGSAGAARGVFFAHTREEEAAADRSGMRFLARAGISPAAMARVMTVFAQQEDVLSGPSNPYVRSHPLSRDRLRAINSYAEVLGPAVSDHEAAEYWYARTQAKLSSYLREPAFTFRRYPTSDTSDAARMARAVAWSKMGQSAKALREMDALLAAYPDDAYGWDLKGWIAMEGRQIPEAVTAYTKAAEMTPNEPQILAGLGRALLARQTADSDAKALDALMQARRREGRDPRLLRDLALAYARTGQPAMASLHTAERYAILGDLSSAVVHAKRAETALPVGSPAWLRAQDIIDAARRASKQKGNR